jgi:CAAX protease family protein
MSRAHDPPPTSRFAGNPGATVRRCTVKLGIAAASGDERQTPIPPLPRRPVTRRTVMAFFALAFLLGWGIAILMLAFQDSIEAVLGPIDGTNPVFVLVVYSPAIAGVFLVWRHYGVRGLGSFFRRFTLVRMPLAWWLLLLLGIPAVKYLGAYLSGNTLELAYSPWWNLLPALLAVAFIGPMEELGWRGVGLPLLQRRFAPFWAGLIVGAFWALWHLPAFALGDTPQSTWSFGPFVVGVIAICMIQVPMFNASRGSLLIAALYHLQLNVPAWPDAQPWENWLFAALAVVVMIVCRRSMFSCRGAVTDVLAPAGTGSRAAEAAPRGGAHAEPALST